jgi:hypothetical protein
MIEHDRPELKIELERIEVALREPQTEERYCALYGAQQALCWAMNPVGFKSPYRTIQLGLVRPPTDIPVGPADYLACSDPRSS